MSDLCNVIRKPLITERATELMARQNKVVLEVDISANKCQVKKAVEQVFNVKVTKVNISRQKGKVKMTRRTPGKQADWKKAVVTLKDGDSIELLENN